MKMLYLHSKTHRRVVRLLVPIVPVILAVILVGTRVPVPEPVARAGHAAATPLWAIRDSVVATVIATYESLDTKEALVRENTVLHMELTELRRQSFMAGVLERENERLRSLAGRNAPDSFVAATVLTSSTYAPFDTFVIDVGTDAGVREGMVVSTAEGIAVGTVASARSNDAVVALFSAVGTMTNVVLSATSTLHATLEGRGGGTMTLSLPRDIPMTVGDVIQLTHWLTLPIGNIVSIAATPEDAYATVYVRSPVNMFELRYVRVDTSHSAINTATARINSRDATSSAEQTPQKSTP